MGPGGARLKVCVQGLWHLGTVTAACLASRGISVSGLDFDAGVVAALRRGEMPLFEPGLRELAGQGVEAGRLAFFDEPGAAVRDIEVLWIAYDTPVDDDDRADVDWVFAQIERTLPHVPPGTTVLVSSQMPVGSAARLDAIAKERFPGRNIGFASSPENLRLGKALDVFLNPDRIVAGVRSERDRERLDRLLRAITDRIEWMSVESAEMTKHAINAFLATSVTFANEVAAICELVGADAKEVERGLKTEARIGPKAYLSPGGAFAGGTLARDVAFLNAIGAARELATPLLSSIKASNDQHKGWAKRKLLAALRKLEGSTVAVWGLTYKPGTDTLRRSLAVELCEWLIDKGAAVQVHDPVVRSLPPAWAGRARRVENEVGALEGAQALVVATEWPQYRKVTADQIAVAAPGIAIIDANRFLGGLAGDGRLRYLSVGTPNRAAG